MLMRLQRNILFSKVLPGCHTNGTSNFISGSSSSQFLSGFNQTAKHGFSAVCGDNLRSYQVVVAATREMGIGKDGKIPWRLPSDLKFFKKLTTTTSDPLKKNAIVMGRKTWESIPLEYRPLAGRLNVVLTRSESSNIPTEENVIRCRNIPSALQLLAQDTYSFSIDKVFVIGGGQIFRETLNGPGCEAIHITEIETRIECDTFTPAINLACYRLWWSSKPLLENGIKFSFATYVRARTAATGSHSNAEVEFNGTSNSNNFEVKDFTFLPRMILERNENDD